MSQEVIEQIPPLSGAIGLSNIRVYDSRAPDGLMGGCPHLHFTCTESYVVLKGKGRVQTLSAAGYADVQLTPGKVVWFTPGVLHRLINQSGDLEILVAMQNAGLPEAGDHVLSFPLEILKDPQAYARHAALADSDGTVYAPDAEACYKRRDLAVKGFNILKSRVMTEGSGHMEEFYRLAVELVRGQVGRWKEVWRESAQKAVETTQDHLEKLSRGDTTHMADGRVYTMPDPGDERHWGFCGHLGKYHLEGAACLPG